MAIGQSKLHDLLRKHRLFSESVAWLETFTPRVKTDILDWIRNDQLKDKGINADGKVIGYYSEVTELITRGRKQAGDHYTLYDTGALFRSMYVAVFKDSIRIDANTSKIEDQEWYTNSILGLTDENFEKLTETVKERYIVIARKILFGTR